MTENISSLFLLLRSQNNHALRNEAALALLDQNALGLDQEISNILQKELLSNNIGTLIYVLAQLDIGKHFELLSKLVIYGNFEAAHESFQALEKLDDIKGSEIDEVYARLSDALRNKSIELWRKGLIVDLMNCFS
jgi:hypothetical protein